MEQIFRFLNKKRIQYKTVENALGIQPGTITRSKGIPPTLLPRIETYLSGRGYVKDVINKIVPPGFKDNVERYYDKGRWKRYSIQEKDNGSMRKGWGMLDGVVHYDSIGHYRFTINYVRIYFKYN